MGGLGLGQIGVREVGTVSEGDVLKLLGNLSELKPFCVFFLVARSSLLKLKTNGYETLVLWVSEVQVSFPNGCWNLRQDLAVKCQKAWS